MSAERLRKISSDNQNWNSIIRKKKRLMRFPKTVTPKNPSKSLELVDKLIAQGININFATESGELALHSAINSNNLLLAKKLINLGADVNYLRCTYGPFQNCTPLHVAVEKENLEIIKLLLQHNASPNARDVTPVLTKAVRKGNFEIVDLLINAGADLNPDNMLGKPLHMAIATNNYKMVDYLIHLGADVNGISRKRTTLQTAVKRGYKDIVQLLLDKKANINDCMNGFTVLCMAIESNFEMVQLLVSAGANLNPVNCCIIPLHWAIIEKNYKAIECLINHGTDVNGIGPIAKYPYYCQGNYSALQLAVMGGDINIVKQLIENGADINLLIDNNDYFEDSLTVLHYAIKYNHENELKFLLDNEEADVNVVTKVKRQSLLHYATKYHQNQVEYLLEAGADINYYNSFGELAISYVNNDDKIPVKVLYEQHIVKWLAAQLFVSLENFTTIKEEDYKFYYDDCLKEINRMKEIKIYNTVHSLYDVLKKSVHDLSFILVNINGICCLSEDFLKTKLPIYGKIVFNRLKKAFHRKFYLEEAYDFLYNVLRDKVPDLIIKEIFRYLTIQDMKRLN